MYKIIKSSTNSETNEVIINVNIDVYHYCYEITSSINIGYDTSGQLDSKSQKEFDKFIEAITKYMKSYNFVPEKPKKDKDPKNPEWHISDRVDSITRYSVWTKDSLLMNPGKTYIVRVRITDHPLSDEGYERGDGYNQREDDKLRKDNPVKDYLNSQMIEIFIDDKCYNSYKDALKEFKEDLAGRNLV